LESCSFFPDGALPSTRQDFAALDPHTFSDETSRVNPGHKLPTASLKLLGPQEAVPSRAATTAADIYSGGGPQ